jgi:putative Ca2+/H+ antiporter (TMEM165/GDT1 family)
MIPAAAEAFLVSVGATAVAEIGDKTQIAALVLTMRFRQPLPIILGVLAATLSNHVAAAFVGQWFATTLPDYWLRPILAIGFLGLAIGAFLPEKGRIVPEQMGNRTAFLVTFLLILVAEMGDKTQLATLALAARYNSVWAVAIGTTLGVMLIDTPAILLGRSLLRYLSPRPMRLATSLTFAGLAAVTLASV